MVACAERIADMSTLEAVARDGMRLARGSMPLVSLSEKTDPAERNDLERASTPPDETAPVTVAG